MESFKKLHQIKKLVRSHFISLTGKTDTDVLLTDQMDLSMLEHVGRASNLAVLMESPDVPALVSRLGPLFCQQKKLRSLLGDMGSLSGEEIEVQKFKTFKPNTRIPPAIYKCIISIMNSQNRSTSYSFVNKPRGNFGRKYVPVPTQAKTQKHIKHSGLIYSNVALVGSSILHYKTSALGSATGKENLHFGQILKLFQLVLHEPTDHGMQHRLYSFLCIYPFEKLSPFETPKNPYPRICPDLNIHIYYAPPAFTDLDPVYRYCDLITLEEIIFHASSFEHDLSVFDTMHHISAVKELSCG